MNLLIFENFVKIQTSRNDCTLESIIEIWKNDKLISAFIVSVEVFSGRDFTNLFVKNLLP